MIKKIKGTVGTFCEFTPGKTVTHINPLTVLRTYIKCDGVPLHWAPVRLAELSSAIEWALKELPSEVLQTQEELENSSYRG